jgi:hypothetical protein
MIFGFPSDRFRSRLVWSFVWIFAELTNCHGVKGSSGHYDPTLWDWDRSSISGPRKKGRSYEKTHDDLDGSNVCAGIHGPAGQRAKRESRCNLRCCRTQECHPDRNGGGVPWLDWSLWLWPRMDQCMPRPLLPVRSLLVTGTIENRQ